MNIKIFNLLEALFFFLPIRKKTILFLSFGGQFNDNPYYIYQTLSNRKDLKFIWLISENSSYKISELPKNANTKYVKLYSFAHLFYSRTSKLIVDNGVGYKSIISKRKMLPLYKLFKKSGQINISTWHGTPLKKIGVFISAVQSDLCFTTSNMLLSGCDYTTQIFKKSFPFKNLEIAQIGTPRNDIFFLKDRLKYIEIKNKLNISFEKKVILFAPTYRDNPLDSGLRQINQFNLKDILDTIKSSFGGSWVFVYRVHQLSKKYIHGEIKKLSQLYEEIDLIDGNLIDDMNEILSITDILISDYSGALFDFALTKRPCFVYAHDLHDYSIQRGLNISLEDLPFPIATSEEELINNITTFDNNAYLPSIDDFLKKIGNIEDGNASIRIREIIDKII